QHTLFGKERQEPLSYYKGFAYATTATPTFVFGKVSRPPPPWASKETATRCLRARLSAAGRGGRHDAGCPESGAASGARCRHHSDAVSPWPPHRRTRGAAVAAGRFQGGLSRCAPGQARPPRHTPPARPATPAAAGPPADLPRLPVCVLVRAQSPPVAAVNS